MSALARRISYADSATTPAGRAVVRLVENATGRLALVRRARACAQAIAEGADLWETVSQRFGIGLAVTEGALELIPARGPLVVVANHPYGILDGLTLGRVLSARRGRDFRILAHKVFVSAPELAPFILPVDFDGTEAAARANLATRAAALAHLAAGGAIGIFPGGTVSTAARPFGRPLDPAWRGFCARMVARSRATVVPLFFEGHNSRLFQLASHLHYTIRLGLLLSEFRRRTGSTVRLRVGQPIPPEALDPLRGDLPALTACLRRATYGLSPDPVPEGEIGHEFEARYRPDPPAARVDFRRVPSY
ncbi:lysophospholipid acyltransferase family protein [Rubellimicrobium sp. CFH 75288]|uniref:lysophospholipid acyltransferase family protein n=1 Tax=Rubellimicrobium sp. CFH 75288 TaxID=2697034 RepID=UPI001411FBA8|nr:lysophospholipid acyltransferase family protein [Rubellimicrobium sp. CFH 75288]NAZ36044.1 acyltransferase [Rubellimicrobium sp. CFH 75288]